MPRAAISLFYARKGLALTERLQANYLVSSYIIFLSSGFKKIFWFTHRHHIKDFAQGMDAGIGLLYHDYKLKPAAVAHRTLTDELEGARPVSNRKIGNSIQSHLFRKEGKDILALWSWKHDTIRGQHIIQDLHSIVASGIAHRERTAGSEDWPRMPSRL